MIVLVPIIAALFLASGLAIAYVIGGAAVLTFIASDNARYLAILPQQIFSKIDVFALMAMPLFILAGELMNRGGITSALINLSMTFVGRLRGGLGHVNIITSVFFAGISGSAVADAVGMGRIIINMMTKDGRYTPSYAAAITAASATIGPIIPPSIPMVLYALVSGTSIGYLFAAGILPGLLMAVMLMVMNATIARRRNFPTDEAIPLRDMVGITGRAIPALMLPVILLGGIYGGVMTPTEAAAVAAFYALFASIVFYRSVKAGQFYQTLLNSARSTATVGDHRNE